MVGIHHRVDFQARLFGGGLHRIGFARVRDGVNLGGNEAQVVRERELVGDGQLLREHRDEDGFLRRTGRIGPTRGRGSPGG